MGETRKAQHQRPQSYDFETRAQRKVGVQALSTVVLHQQLKIDNL